jgi:hypothetical protein
MEHYYFSGIVLPERAHITLEKNLGFRHFHSGQTGIARVSILLNQIAIWVETETPWEIFDLRNTVKTIIRSQLSIFAYLNGLAYDFEITRIINQQMNVNTVFGIDVPCISQRNFNLELESVSKLTIGKHGIFIMRCFADLAAAIKYDNDTAFYCYRAIESIRNHYAATEGMNENNENAIWGSFREFLGCSKDIIMNIKNEADPLRHGKNGIKLEMSREKILTTTWMIVDLYTEKLTMNDATP